MGRTFRCLAVLGALVIGGVGSAFAVGPSVPAAKGQDTFTLQPGGKATLTFESFCIDYGKKFPTAVGLPPTDVADAKVVGALNYALNKDYTTSAPKEVEYAIWQARGASGSPAPGPQGSEIAQNSSASAAAPSGATSVIDALKQNKIKATSGTWAGIGDKLTINGETTNFQGRGDLMIENTAQQALTLYMPTGTVFPAPSAEFQSMAGYMSNVKVENPQQLPDTGAVPTEQIAVLLSVALVFMFLGFQLRRNQPI